MKILFLAMANRKANMDGFYLAMTENSDCEILYLDSDQQDNLKLALRAYDLGRYDYVLVMLRTKKLMKQCSYLGTINNLVFVEYDTWLNYYPNKYKDRFTRLYNKTKPFLIISSGLQVTEKLKAEGFRAEFIPKGYDHLLLRNLGCDRDIKLGFIGSTKNDAYTSRKFFLEEAAIKLGVTSFKTDSGQDYLNGLNRIDCFVSADIEFGEYMLKNFEAMACGCVLLAYDQGELENSALGFKDMENVVLYKTLGELSKKIDILDQDVALKEQIRANGQKLSEDKYGFDKIVSRLIEILSNEQKNLSLFKNNKKKGLLERLGFF